MRLHKFFITHVVCLLSINRIKILLTLFYLFFFLQETSHRSFFFSLLCKCVKYLFQFWITLQYVIFLVIFYISCDISAMTNSYVYECTLHRPTFYKIFKAKSVGNFSGIPYAVTLLNCALWIFYGLPSVSNQILVTSINSVGFGLEVIYIIIHLIYGTKETRVQILHFITFIYSIAID